MNQPNATPFDTPQQFRSPIPLGNPAQQTPAQQPFGSGVPEPSGSVLDVDKITADDLTSGKVDASKLTSEQITEILLRPEPEPAPTPAPTTAAPDGTQPTQQPAPSTMPWGDSFKPSIPESSFGLDVTKLQEGITQNFAGFDFSTALADEENPAAFNEMLQSALTAAVTSALQYSMAASHQGINNGLPDVLAGLYKVIADQDKTKAAGSVDVGNPTLKPMIDMFTQQYMKNHPNATAEQIKAATELQVNAIGASFKPAPAQKSPATTNWDNF